MYETDRSLLEEKNTLLVVEQLRILRGPTVGKHEGSTQTLNMKHTGLARKEGLRGPL